LSAAHLPAAPVAGGPVAAAPLGAPTLAAATLDTSFYKFFLNCFKLCIFVYFDGLILSSSMPKAIAIEPVQIS
jgi:hypothetical protein